MSMAMRIRDRLCSLTWPGRCKKPQPLRKHLALFALGLLPIGGWAQALAPGLAADSAPVAPAQRIVSLAPHITELVFAAGAADRLVGTVHSSDYPPAARTLPRVGDGLHIDPETLVSLEPDLVLGWQAGATQTVAPILKALNIPLIHINPTSVSDIPDAIETIGRLTNNSITAQKVAESIRERLYKLSRTAPAKPVSVVLEISATPLYVVGNDPLLTDALRYCNATNHFANVLQAAPLISVENLLARPPDFIVVRSKPHRTMTERIEYLANKGVRAARQKKIIGLDPDLLFRPGPRLVDALEQLCAQLLDQR